MRNARFTHLLILKISFQVPNPVVTVKEVFECFRSYFRGVKDNSLELSNNQFRGQVGEFSLEKQENQTYTLSIPLNFSFKKISSFAAHCENIARISSYTCTIVYEDLKDLRRSTEERIEQRARELEEKILSHTDVATSLNWNSYLVDHPLGFKISRDFNEEDEIIVVEGVHDARALLLAGWKNFLVLGGTSFNCDNLKKLLDSKIITLFLDGDNTGRKITEYLTANLEVDFIALSREPVEELSERLVSKVLAQRVPINVYRRNLKRSRKYPVLPASNPLYGEIVKKFSELCANDCVFLDEGCNELKRINLFSLEENSLPPAKATLFEGILNKYLYNLLVEKIPNCSLVVARDATENIQEKSIEIFIL